MASNLTLQSTISAAGFEHVVAQDTRSELIDRGFSAMGLQQVGSDFNHGNTTNALCEWMSKNTWVEPTLYDHKVPADSVTPISLHDDDLPWNALTWCVDPYQNKHPYPNLGAQFYDACMVDKSEPYLMKSLDVRDVELSWLCYNYVDSVYLLHHNQIRGTMRDRISRTDQVWCHRYMIRMFADMLPRGSTIIIPDSQTFDKYLEIHPELLRMPMTPFSKHVLGKSKFKAIDGTALCNIAPNLHDSLYFTHELSSVDQKYWIRTT